jgi:DNA polymerase/3'-5' exonuclease PolX
MAYHAPTRESLAATSRPMPGRTEDYSLENALVMFARLADAHDDQYRAMAYRRALVSLRDPSVTTGDDIRAKIDEYRATGRIKEFDNLMKKKSNRALIEFDDVLGFGPASARKLVERRIYSRAQLLDTLAQQQKQPRGHAIEITRVQELGLRYYDDLHRAIPRATVARIAEAIMTEVYKESESPSEGTIAPDPGRAGVRVEVAGSYRRRAPESRDIDILVARNDVREGLAPNRAFLRALHERMRAHSGLRHSDGADVDDVFEFVDIVMMGSQKYSFLLRAIRENHVISVDIIVVGAVEYWSALLYFTGSREFNVWMREQCKKRGYSLSQYGLRDSHGDMIRLESEEHIFAILGLPYVEPVARTHAPTIS